MFSIIRESAGRSEFFAYSVGISGVLQMSWTRPRSAYSSFSRRVVTIADALLGSIYIRETRVPSSVAPICSPTSITISAVIRNWSASSTARWMSRPCLCSWT